MALEDLIKSKTFVSAADLSAKQYFLAKMDTAGKAVLAAAGTDKIEGVITEGGKASGDPVTVGTHGEAKVLAGGTVAINDRITSDSAGKGIATTTANDYSIGRARTAAAAGEYFEMVIERWKY